MKTPKFIIPWFGIPISKAHNNVFNMWWAILVLINTEVPWRQLWQEILSFSQEYEMGGYIFQIPWCLKCCFSNVQGCHCDRVARPPPSLGWGRRPIWWPVSCPGENPDMVSAKQLILWISSQVVWYYTDIMNSFSHCHVYTHKWVGKVDLWEIALPKQANGKATLLPVGKGLDSKVPFHLRSCNSSSGMTVLAVGEKKKFFLLVPYG